MLCFGGSKIGALAAEAVIVFEPEKARELKYIHKRSGHVLSKMRFLAAQFEALLEGDHWLDLARHGNAMAARLAAGVARLPGVNLAWPARRMRCLLPLPPRALPAGARTASRRMAGHRPRSRSRCRQITRSSGW